MSRLATIAIVFAGFAMLGSAFLIGLRAVESHATDDSTNAGGAVAVPTIVVIGRGSASLPIDSAAVVIGIEGTWPTLEESQQRLNAAIDAAVTAGVPASDVVTISYQVATVQAVGIDGSATLDGVQVNRRVGIIVRDLSILDAVLASVAESDVTVYGVGLGSGDPGAATAVARAAAMADARARADQLAASLGVTILHAEETVELTASPPPPSLLALAVSDPTTAPPPATGEIKIEVQVTYSVSEDPSDGSLFVAPAIGAAGGVAH